MNELVKEEIDISGIRVGDLYRNDSDVELDSRLEDFLRRYSHLFERAVRCWELGRGEWLLFEMEDERTLLYDVFDRRVLWVKLIDEDSLLTEEEWRQGFSFRLQERLLYICEPRCELADRIGITSSMFSRYITGKATPSSYTLYKLAQVLECEVEELMPRYFIPLD